MSSLETFGFCLDVLYFFKVTADNRQFGNLCDCCDSPLPRQHAIVKPWIFPLLLLMLGPRCFGSVTIMTTSLPNGSVGTAYAAAVKGSGGCSPYKWAIVSGSLPAGVTAKASSTTTSLNLTGKPTTAASYYFTVKVTACGGGTSQRSYKVVVQAVMSSTVNITTTFLPNGTVGTDYSALVKASGGCTPYKWAIASGSLPAGVSARVSSTTTSLNLNGTPTTAATQYFTVKVTGCGGHISQKSYKVAVQAATSVGIGITTTSVPSGTVGSAYSAAVKASGGCTPYKWAIASGSLPAGVNARVSSTTTSLNLTGTLTTGSTYSFTVKVIGCGGGTSQRSYKVAIQSATSGGIGITTTSLPNGTVGTAYSAAAKATGGCTPYKWAIASGSLPSGITAKASSTTTSLILTGTPTMAATYYFSVKVTGCGGGTSQIAYEVAIQATANHVVDLSWKASTSSNIAGYNVYRSLDGTTWKKINVSLIGSTLYSDSTVANGSTYYYSATAVDIYGHESGKTSAIKVVIP